MRGVPALLDTLKALGVRASFYVSMGPDNSGRAIRRVLKPGFLNKMRRTNAVGTYGFPTLVYGLLWPGPMISTSHPSLLKRIVAEGHETGIHGYDHVLWHDMLAGMDERRIAQQLDKALELYRRLVGKDPKGFAAPGWAWTQTAQQLFTRYRFSYTSNTRGVEPYFPVFNGKTHDLLEIPTTLPTLDEVLGNKAQTMDELSSFFLRKLHHQGVHVWTLHAELEGQAYLGWFSQMLNILKEEGAVFRTLGEYAEECLEQKASIPSSDVLPGYVDGRATELALQGLGAKLAAPEI